ncbi:protein translocase subunit SecF [Marmoricola sp. RAF53]|uniref:protein translocase subunit SecF n=1 Tax=Marmoricola sp. RAF53 TaxID=3233059 RepID=UPI003F987A57
MGKLSRLGNDLYEGKVSVDFVGRKWLWYSISGVLLVLSVTGLLVKGLNLGIEFEGGTEISASVSASEANQDNVTKVADAVVATGVEEAANPQVNKGATTIRVTTETLTSAQEQTVTAAMAETLGIPDSQIDTKISVQKVGASWGKEVAKRAITGLIVFLILVVLFIWAYFREWKMSIAALVALAHDILITVGVYALSGFEVTPATVTGILTILGFSLYDTVVVFDKIRENTKNLRQSRRSYAELANLAVNQSLVRSINTSIVALLPVGALLYVGIFQLGSGPLKDLALALFVGMAVGAYSSIFIATPLLVQLKQGEKEISEQAARAKARQRRDADRYASVPSFSEGMPLADGPDLPEEGAEGEPADSAPLQAPFQAPASRPSATGSGRVVPSPKAPVEDSGSAHRPQPNRQPRSKRGK